MLTDKAFIRNTICYFIPFLIMTIVAVFSLNYTFSILQEQNYEIVRTQLHRGMEEVEEKLFVSRQLALEISLDSTLSDSEVMEYKLTTIKGINKLFGYKQRMDVCSHLFVTYAQDNIITDSFTSSMNTFCDVTLKLTEESKKFVHDMMQSRSDGSKVLSADNGRRYILMLYYYPKSSYVNERWVGFVITESVLAKRVQSSLGDMDSLFVLTYGDQILSEINQLNAEVSEQEVSRMYQTMRDGSGQISGHTVVVEQGIALDLKLYVALSNATYTKALLRQQITVFTIAISVFCLLSLFLWQYSRYRYKKAQAVQLMAVNMYPEMTGNESRGEYEFIQKVLERGYERLQTHDQMLEYLRKESKRQLTWLLLKSALPEEFQIDELMENCGLETWGAYHGVLNFLLVREGEQMILLDEIQQVLMYHVERSELGEVLMVILSLEHRDESHKARLELSERILRQLQLAGYICQGITCGMIYEELNEVHSSQEEAYSLLPILKEHRRTEQTKVLFFDEVTQMSKRVPHITSDILQQFKECLLEDRQSEAVKLLTHLLTPPKDKAQNLLTYTRYKVIQIMIEVCQIKGVSSDILNQLLALVDIEGDDFADEVKKQIALLATHAETNNIDAEQVLEFISVHALDNDISLCSIANYFGISERSVSRIMKDNKNKTYKEYISELRIHKACELLRQNDLDIQTIANQVGYYNVTSFNRLFKQMCGMSPGEYRMTHF